MTFKIEPSVSPPTGSSYRHVYKCLTFYEKKEEPSSLPYTGTITASEALKVKAQTISAVATRHFSTLTSNRANFIFAYQTNSGNTIDGAGIIMVSVLGVISSATGDFVVNAIAYGTYKTTPSFSIVVEGQQASGGYGWDVRISVAGSGVNIQYLDPLSNDTPLLSYSTTKNITISPTKI